MAAVTLEAGGDAHSMIVHRALVGPPLVDSRPDG